MTDDLLATVKKALATEGVRLGDHTMEVWLRALVAQVEAADQAIVLLMAEREAAREERDVARAEVKRLRAVLAYIAERGCLGQCAGLAGAALEADHDR